MFAFPSYLVMRLASGLHPLKARSNVQLFLSKCCSPPPWKLLDQRSSGDSLSRPREARILSETSKRFVAN